MNITYSLICGLLICHYFADFIMVRPHMLKAKAIGKPIVPIMEHAFDHVSCMALFLFFVPVLDNNWYLKIIAALTVQFITHTIIDVVKGRLNIFEHIKNPQNKIHWVVFGGDQLLHQLVILFMVKILTF